MHAAGVVRAPAHLPSRLSAPLQSITAAASRLAHPRGRAQQPDESDAATHLRWSPSRWPTSGEVGGTEGGHPRTRRAGPEEPSTVPGASTHRPSPRYDAEASEEAACADLEPACGPPCAAEHAPSEEVARRVRHIRPADFGTHGLGLRRSRRHELRVVDPFDRVRPPRRPPERPSLRARAVEPSTPGVVSRAPPKRTSRRAPSRRAVRHRAPRECFRRSARSEHRASAIRRPAPSMDTSEEAFTSSTEPSLRSTSAPSTKPPKRSRVGTRAVAFDTRRRCKAFRRGPLPRAPSRRPHSMPGTLGDAPRRGPRCRAPSDRAPATGTAPRRPPKRPLASCSAKPTPPRTRRERTSGRTSRDLDRRGRSHTRRVGGTPDPGAHRSEPPNAPRNEAPPRTVMSRPGARASPTAEAACTSRTSRADEPRTHGHPKSHQTRLREDRKASREPGSRQERTRETPRSGARPFDRSHR